MKSLTYVEIDVPDFAASSPEVTETYRFAKPVDYLPDSIEAIPSIVSLSFTPATISLGENLGERASLTVTFQDHKHILGSESFDSGTFWGKWRARYGQRLRGRPLRWITGLEGQTLVEMETRHFVIESTDGPDPSGTYSIVAKDVLKLADDDRAQAPLLSTGFIVANITNTDTSATLSPSGIGNAEYPASGFVAIGGEEICAFTRSGDTLTLTRGQLGTVAVAHEAGDRAQLVLQYSGEDPADIIYDLLVNYAGVPSSYINLTTWQTETAAYLQRLYTAAIPEPVSVKKLVSELIEQAALALWWEPLTQQLRLQVLRAIPTNAATYDEDVTIQSSLKIKDQPSKRISQVWTYFGQRDPLKPIDEPDNFRSVALTADLETETAYGTPAIKKIYSRWIPFGGRQVALRLNDILLGRFKDPPRKISFDLFRYPETAPMLGGGYRLKSWCIQDIDGSSTDTPIQVTRLNPVGDRYSIECEEMLFSGVDQVDLINRVIIIDSAINNVNLRTLHDSIYPDPDIAASPAESLTIYIEENVIVGSANTSSPALDVGSWPSSYPITIVNRGRIQGAGGKGGNGGSAGSSILFNGRPGSSGGLALYCRQNITLDNYGDIWGGGGGGGGGAREAVSGSGESNNPGGSGGGGGAGQVAGAGGIGGTGVDSGSPGESGTSDSGGAGGTAYRDGGNGGGPGQAGSNGTNALNGGATGGSGGSAGKSIDGISYITLNELTGSDIRGAQVN